MNSEREKEILKIIYQKRTVTVKQLSQMLYASEPSIRRDLSRLEKQHLLKRFHGGAKIEAAGPSNLRVPYMMRELEMVDEKELIARKAMSLVKDKDVIFIDKSKDYDKMSSKDVSK